jgi:hypothetical protein
MQRPHLVSYMDNCARRQGFAAAFGSDIQDLVLDELDFCPDGDRGSFPPNNNNNNNEKRRNTGNRQLFSPVY